MNSNTDWQLKIRDRVLKDVTKFPKRDQAVIADVLENEVGINPYLGDIEKIKGEENSWRRRTGNYRIFYEIIVRDKTIYIFRIERRTSKTY